MLTIKAERRFDYREGDEVIAAERPHGAFTGQLFLGDTLGAGRLVASYETGVLTLRIPVAESAKPRKVQITEGADRRTESYLCRLGIGQWNATPRWVRWDRRLLRAFTPAVVRFSIGRPRRKDETA